MDGTGFDLIGRGQAAQFDHFLDLRDLMPLEGFGELIEIADCDRAHLVGEPDDGGGTIAEAED